MITSQTVKAPLKDYEAIETPSATLWRNTKQIGSCPNCGSNDHVGHGSVIVTVMDVPDKTPESTPASTSASTPISLLIDRRRARCTGCGRTFSEPLPHIAPNRAMTARLVAWILREAMRRSYVSIAKDIGVTEGNVRSVFTSYLDGLDEKTRAEVIIERKNGRTKR
jgi:transposase